MFQISAVFEELLFGSGAWLGLILVLLLCIAGAFMFKYAGTIFGLILIFLGVQYLENVAETNYFIWSVVICWVTAIFLFYKVAGEMKN